MSGTARAAMPGLVLGIESSCDETAAAVVRDGVHVVSSVVATQHDLHARYGGVVPEIASRAHVERILPVIRDALAGAGVAFADLDGIAVANRPGLIGSLVVGTSAAKALAWALGRPLAAVDHVESHLYACVLDATPLAGDALGLVVSGGHTSLYLLDAAFRPRRLGGTIDDALGEAYDKVAALLGLGHPGGPEVDRLAAEGDERAFDFPVAHVSSNPFAFSFSGLKTAVLYAACGTPERGSAPSRDASHLAPAAKADLCASFQRAAVRAATRNVQRALDAHPGIRTVCAGGGVVANSRLRADLAALCAKRRIELRLPPGRFCIDNAAMIAGLGALRLAQGDAADLAVAARAS